MEEIEDVIEFTHTTHTPEPIFTFDNVYSIATNKFDQTEFCFQFDDDEPITFAISDGSAQTPALTFTINNGTDGSIEFKGMDNKKFKIFARELK